MAEESKKSGPRSAVTFYGKDFRIPSGPFIGSQAKRLYRLEEKRSEAIRAAALELAVVLGLPEEGGRFWTETMPEELLTILQGYEKGAAAAAALALLRKEFPEALVEGWR